MADLKMQSLLLNHDPSADAVHTHVQASVAL